MTGKKKILVIGLIGDDKTAKETVKRLAEEQKNCDVELVHIDPETAKQKGLIANQLIVCEPMKIETYKKMEIPFMPKAKHEPKGHERKYKYHR